MRKLITPYREIDWSWNQYKANFHTHSTESDGRLYGKDVIEQYKDLNYDILVITDHDIQGYRHNIQPNEHNAVPYINTWEWDIFEGSEPYQAPVGSLKRESINGIVNNGMLTFEGVELSGIHHIGSFNNPYAGEVGYTNNSALNKVRKNKGVAVVFHPGEYNYRKKLYRDLYQSHRGTLVGMEVINRNRYFDGGSRPNARGDESDFVLWDYLYNEFSGRGSFMSRQKMWGYSNDDMHLSTEIGGNYQFVMMPELNSDNLINAMKKGRSYFSYEPDRSGEAKAPRITSVNIDDDNRTVTINSPNADVIKWVKDGEETDVITNHFNYDDNFNFFRAKLSNEFGDTYTQPFILGTEPLMFKWQ